MSLRFLGGETGSCGSPRLYQEGDDYLVQGYTVTDAPLLAELNIPDGETVVRVPQSLWKYLPAAEEEDGQLVTWPTGAFELAVAAQRRWLDLLE